MKLKLHKYSNDELYLRLEPENDTERDLIKFLIGDVGVGKKLEAFGDAINGLFIQTNKKLK